MSKDLFLELIKDDLLLLDDQVLVTEDLNLRYLGDSTYKSIQDWSDTTQSGGRISGGAILDDGDGTITVSAGSGIIKCTDDNVGPNYFFNWEEDSSLVLVDNDVNYVYITCSGMIPTIYSTIDRDTITLTNEITLGRVLRNGTDLHIIDSGVQLDNLPRREHERLLAVRGAERATGMVVAETGNRFLTATAGVFYLGSNREETAAQDTTGTDRITYWYNDGAWQSITDQTVVDNLQFNNYGVGLANLTVQHYGVHWVYIHYDGDINIVYGTGNYILANAENAVAPSTLPDSLSSFGLLVAKIIVKQNDPNFTSIGSAFEKVFPTTAVQIHNDLAGLQGGQATQYYHLNLGDYNSVTGFNFASAFAYLNVEQLWLNHQNFTPLLGDSSKWITFRAIDNNDGLWLYYTDSGGAYLDCWGSTNFVISTGDTTGYINFMKNDYVTPMARFSTSSFEIDSIAEMTADAGITLDTFLTKDGEVYLADNKKAYFGDTNDISMYWDGTDFKIDALTVDSKFKVTNVSDLYFSTGLLNLRPSKSTLFHVPGGRSLDLNGAFKITGTAIYPISFHLDAYFLDNTKLAFGTGQDATILYDGTDLIVNTDAVGTGSLKVNSHETRADGSVNFVTLADAAAANSSMYYSSDQSKMVWKDSGGTVNVLY